MIIQARTWNFVKVLHFYCLLARSIAHSIFEHAPPCRRTTLPSLREASPTAVNNQLLQHKYVIQTWFCNRQQHLYFFHIVFEYIPSLRDQEMKLVRQDQRFHQFLPHGSHIMLLSSHFHVIPLFSNTNNPFSRGTKRHSQFGTFSQPCFNRIFSNCLPMTILLMGVHTNFVREVPRDLQCCPGFRPFVSWKTYPYVWTF